MLTYHHQFLLLVEDFHQFSYQAVLRLFMICFVFDGNGGSDGIANEYRPREPQPLISIGHSYFIDDLRRKAYPYRENKRTVRNAFFERLRFAPFFIHVVGKEIA